MQLISHPLATSIYIDIPYIVSHDFRSIDVPHIVTYSSQGINILKIKLKQYLKRLPLVTLPSFPVLVKRMIKRCKNECKGT